MGVTLEEKIDAIVMEKKLQPSAVSAGYLSAFEVAQESAPVMSMFASRAQCMVAREEHFFKAGMLEAARIAEAKIKRQSNDGRLIDYIPKTIDEAVAHIRERAER